MRSLSARPPFDSNAEPFQNVLHRFMVAFDWLVIAAITRTDPSV